MSEQLFRPDRRHTDRLAVTTDAQIRETAAAIFLARMA
jgi:hypothetical protein